MKLPWGKRGNKRGQCRTGRSKQGGMVDVAPDGQCQRCRQCWEERARRSQPPPGAGGLWIMLLNTVVHAWCHGLAMPALARVAQPDPLWSWKSPYTSK